MRSQEGKISPLFAQLPEEKRERIIDACREEFAIYGYINASTNRIVKKCGIAKGSLFLYFKDKSSLFIFLCVDSVRGAWDYIREKNISFSSDIFQRVRQIVEMNLGLYRDNPALIRFILAVSKGDCIPDTKTAREKSREIFIHFDREMMEGISTDGLKYEPEFCLSSITLMLSGLTHDFHHSITHGVSWEYLRDFYLPRLDTALDILKKGIYRGEQVVS